MSNTQHSSSHGKLIAVLIAAALVIILALISAFVWPGWALNGQTQPATQETTTSTESSTPTISATPLPEDATELLKSMPDSVLNFARTAASPSATWGSSSPLEEYIMTYSTGEDALNITLIAAQWSAADNAKTQYDALVGGLSGQELSSGNVKVNGSTVGSYTVKTDASDDTKAVAVWQNDTAVFQASGLKESVLRFYEKFPM